MKRTLAMLLSAALVLAFSIAPAVAEDSDDDVMPPSSATSESSPQAGELEAGEREYTDSDGNVLTIELSGIHADQDAEAIIAGFDPEDGIDDSGLEYVEEIDTVDGCREFEYSSSGKSMFVSLCSNDDFGLWTFGTDQDDVEHVAQQFVDGESDLVPEGYDEDSGDDDAGDDVNDDIDDDSSDDED